MTRKRTNCKHIQTFKRGLPKLCLADMYIDTGQGHNLHVTEGNSVSLLFFLLKKSIDLKQLLHDKKKQRKDLPNSASQGLNATLCLHQLLSQWFTCTDLGRGPAFRGRHQEIWI